jgi:predicted transcriptional regulator
MQKRSRKMAKRNNRIDTEVIALAVTGLSQRAIAEKLSISQATVSKILQDNKNSQKLSKAQEVIENNQEVIKISNQKTAHNVIDKIITGLEKDLERASLKDKRELLKTLVELFGMPETDNDDKIEKIEVEFEDASGDSEDKDSETV